MNHRGTVTLESERLILRILKLSDAKKCFENWMNSETVTKYLTWLPHQTSEESQAYISSVSESYEQENQYHWVITLKETGEPIGAIDANDIKEEVECVEIGYCLSDRFWGKGIMTEALRRVIRFFFDEVGAHRIQATHDARNPASGRVMEKCSMKYEGTLRAFDRNNQGLCDSVIRAIIKEDET